MTIVIGLLLIYLAFWSYYKALELTTDYVASKHVDTFLGLRMLVPRRIRNALSTFWRSLKTRMYASAPAIFIFGMTALFILAIVQ